MRYYYLHFTEVWRDYSRSHSLNMFWLQFDPDLYDSRVGFPYYFDHQTQ